MSLLSNARSFLPGFSRTGVPSQVKRLESETLNAVIQNPEKKGLLSRLKQFTVWRVENDLKTWREAVEWAESPQNPNRMELLAMYRVAMQDAHLLSQVRTAQNQIVLGEYEVLDESGLPDDDAREWLEASWFDRFLEECVDTELWGFTLLEFSLKSRREDGKFTEFFRIPRAHVRPEYGDVVFDTGTEVGVSFMEGKWTKFLIPIGDRTDLGILKELTPIAIRKLYNMLDWSRRNEKFGMPFIIGKTASRQQAELDEKARMLSGFGSNNWALLDDMDGVELLETKSGSNAHKTYQDYIDMLDSNISQLVNGQSGTQDEQAHVGSAKVHERILNSYTKARMRRIQNTINERLFPFLIKHDYPLVGRKFEFTELRPSAGMQTSQDSGDTQEKEAEGK